MTPKPPKATKSLTATAYHEAGHAVIAWHLRLGIGRVSIVPDPDRGSLGHIETKVPRWIDPDVDLSPAAQDWLQRRIQMSLAGRASEKLFTGRWNHVGARGDYRSATDLALYVCGSSEEISAFIKWLDLRTRATVKFHGAQIAKVAAALLEHHTLRPRDVERLIQEWYKEAGAHRRAIREGKAE